MILWKKKLVFIVIIVILMVLTASCNNETPDLEEKTLVQIGALRGPTGMGMAKLMSDSENSITSLDYDIQIVGSPNELVGKIINGEVDIAAVPTNLALVLYNRTEGDIQLAAVNTLGVLYLLEQGDSIETVSDLKGKTVNVSGKGATPDFVFKYILEANGLAPDKDVLIDFALQHADLATALVAGDVDIAMLPQPHVTTAMIRNDDLRIALDITEEWSKVMDDSSKLAMGCIIVQKEFAENNKKELNMFLEEYEESIKFVNDSIDDSALLIEEYGILPNAQIAKKAIPYSNIVYIDSQDAKSFLEDFYNVLYDFNPSSVGGKLADDGFY